MELDFDNPQWLFDRIKARLSQLPRTNGVTDPEETAVALHEVLRQAAIDSDMKPDIEVFLRRPGEPKQGQDKNCWLVSWEAGPYCWAHGACYVVMDATGRLCEPHYSFDLCLYAVE